MIKKIAFLSAASSIALVAQPAAAAEHVAGFTTPGVMTADTAGTGTWALTNGVEWTATNVVNKRLYLNDGTLLKGHKYDIVVTIPVWTQGMLSLAIGAPKHAILGGDVPVTDGANGLTTIPDNFPTANGLRTTTEVLAPDSSADPNGAFRFVAGVAKFAQDDPMLFPCLPGASHLHMFVGNTGVNACSTYKSLRESGGTSAGDPRYPVNRSAYWMPAMLNGHGSAVKPAYINVYYKQLPAGHPACQPLGNPVGPDATHIGYCVTIPNGLRYVAGWNSSTMMNEQTAYRFECHQQLHTDDRDPAAPDTYTSIDDMVDAGCPAGAIVYELLEAPTCWDGQRVDSADHRSHVHYPQPADGNVTITWTTNGVTQGPTTIGKCPLSHPYNIPSFSMQVYWNTKGDPTFRQKKWHLSSDEQMTPQMKAGLTAHMDYWEGWSPTVKAAWTQHCNNEHRSCAAGFLGDGTYIFTNRFSSPQLSGTALVSRARLGWSEPMMGAGTFRGEVTAIDSGQLYLNSYDGFSGKVSVVSVTDVTPPATHSPVTVHSSR